MGVSRFEVMPFGHPEQQAAELPAPTRLTVTCSPRHGIDESITTAERLAALGHAPVVHLAARMVRSDEHLDELLGRMAAAGMADVFVVGGDGPEPLGPYASAVDLLPVVAAHPQRPRDIGIAAYPEGHPRIEPDVLFEALRRKSEIASYMATQICFDAGVLLEWLRDTRERGVALPVLVGVPGMVDRRKLVEISMRVGVGPSLTYVRKQRGLRHLFSRPVHAAVALYDAVAPHIGDPALGISGVHWFTFNQLLDTWTWESERRAAGSAAGKAGA
jgi:methylenetetrahydrofolate reductase (NADPH)